MDTCSIFAVLCRQRGNDMLWRGIGGFLLIFGAIRLLDTESITDRMHIQAFVSWVSRDVLVILVVITCSMQSARWFRAGIFWNDGLLCLEPFRIATLSYIDGLHIVSKRADRDLAPLTFWRAFITINLPILCEMKVKTENVVCDLVFWKICLRFLHFLGERGEVKGVPKRYFLYKLQGVSEVNFFSDHKQFKALISFRRTNLLSSAGRVLLRKLRGECELTF